MIRIIRIKSESYPGCQIHYPASDDGYFAVFDRFYESLRDALRDYAAERIRTDTGKADKISAECSYCDENGRITVRIRLRLRSGGRTIGEKTLLHVWENGWLVPPSKNKRKRSLPRKKPRFSCIRGQKKL